MKWPIFEQKHHYILILEKTMLVCINTNRVTCLLTCVRFRMHQFEGNLQADLTATQTESNVSHCSRVERMNSQNTRQQSRQLHVINYASSWTEKDTILKALQGLKLLYFIIWWLVSVKVKITKFLFKKSIKLGINCKSRPVAAMLVFYSVTSV